jgi:hypothetical protein
MIENEIINEIQDVDNEFIENKIINSMNQNEPKQILKDIGKYKVIEYDKTNIYIIENILDASFCQEMIELINASPLRKNFYGPGNNVQCYVKNINELLKLSEESYYTFSTEPNEYEKLMNKEPIWTNEINGLTKKDIEKKSENINNIMEKIGDIMKEINNNIVFETNSGYCLRKIYGKTRNHIDNISEVHNTGINFIKNNKMGDYKMVRNASIIFTLNDDYQGGEFKFTYHDIKVKLKKGSVIIFPPFWTHPHETEDLINDTYRYTINTWSCQKIN